MPPPPTHTYYVHSYYTVSNSIIGLKNAKNTENMQISIMQIR